MKTLYKFDLLKEEFVEKTETIKDPETGQDIKLTKKVKEAVKKEYALIKPTRGLFESAELFYNVRHSEAVRAGIMPFALVSKRIKDDHGLLTDEQEKEYKEIISKLVDKQRELEIPENKGNVEKINELNKELNDLRNKMREVQDLQTSIFDNTAESYARKKTVFWWVLQMAYLIENGELKPFFGEGKYEDKLKKYDELELLDDSFINSVIFKFTYYTNLWYITGPKDEEAFKKSITLIEKDYDLVSETEKEVSAPTSEVVV